ncbi:hypothetical protein V8D89_012084, partial [Ganoderma adspersum]
RTRNDNMDVVSPESPSPCKSSTPYKNHMKASSQKRPADIKSSEDESDDDLEQEHPSPSKKLRQRSPELEYNPTPKTSKNSNAAICARGFEKAQVIITSRPARQVTSKPITNTNKGGKPSKAPEPPKKGRNLFVDNESLDDVDGSGEEPESDLSAMCIDSDSDRKMSRSGSPPSEYVSAEEDSAYTSSKKGKKPRAPTPYSDSEDTATGQMNDMSLQTPQRPTCTSNRYPPIADLTNLSADPGLNEHLPHLKAILYAVGLRGSLKDGVINPARWEPSNATSIRGNGNGTSRVLAIDGPHRSRRVVVATFGTVLQSDIVKSTPSYVGSTQQVQQVILAPFEHEWTCIYRFYGTVFDKYEFNISIFGSRIMGGNGDKCMHGLQIRSWPSEKSSNGPQAIVPIWDARPQFLSGKYLMDGIFSIEDTFKLPKLEGEDLQHGDIALIYHSVTMYPKDRTTAMGLSFGLYGAVLIGRPT